MGDIDYFYLSKNENAFANGDASEEDIEVYAEIIKIVHRELGEVKGIYTEELSYRILSTITALFKWMQKKILGK